MRQLRKPAAVALALVALAGGTTLAVAADGGGAHGNSGKSQYGSKPGCGPDKPDGMAGASGRHTGQPPKDQDRGDCPTPPGQSK